MWKSAMVTWLDPVLDLIYPPRCSVCGEGSESPLCDTCLAAIAPVPLPHCNICGQSLGERSQCNHCTRRQPAFDAALALGAYEGVLESAIHHLKYRDRPQLAEPLGVALAAFVTTGDTTLSGLNFDMVIPVPMSPGRQRVRGYNQAERLARVVARELSIPLNTTAAIRSQSVRPQVGLSRKDRQQNLSGAFAVKDATAVAGKTILLIDDVSTTGSSLHEVAMVLTAAGAKGVYGLTLAAG